MIDRAVVHLKSGAESPATESAFGGWIYSLGTDFVLGLRGYRGAEIKILFLNCAEAKRNMVTTVTVGSWEGHPGQSDVWEPGGRAACFLGESEGFTEKVMFQRGFEGWIGVWE